VMGVAFSIYSDSLDTASYKPRRMSWSLLGPGTGLSWAQISEENFDDS